ncbi:interleukin-1 beta-like [Xyrichtys novacula]|uniref:Interleukin-1 n=1 Tax=Xyrichtys novacula TaxID=13765 RepID=A0AAV1G7H8_XYRNO|nr:interleukin-1 beta-like [Xyrichtys novacula]
MQASTGRQYNTDRSAAGIINTITELQLNFSSLYKISLDSEKTKMDSKMQYNMSEKWAPRMPKGVDLEITHHPLKMKDVVNLIVAMERLKGGVSESLRSTEFRDENLLDIMLESIVEERVVFECESAPPLQFSRTGVHQCSVTDSEQRSLVLVRNSMELHAVMLQGGADKRKVHLNMSTYVHPAPTTAARTVALGIKDTNLYMSCHKDGDEVTLHLEEIEDKDSLLRIGSDSNMVRFLFYKQDSGLNISTLVSVAYSDWFISTATDNNKPVEMCLESAQRHRHFKIQRQS